MRIVAGTADTPAEPSLHKMRIQNGWILRVVVTKPSLYARHPQYPCQIYYVRQKHHKRQPLYMINLYQMNVRKQTEKLLKINSENSNKTVQFKKLFSTLKLCLHK